MRHVAIGSRAKFVRRNIFPGRNDLERYAHSYCMGEDTWHNLIYLNDIFDCWRRI